MTDLGGSFVPVKPGLEREFIEFLKSFFRKQDRNPALVRTIEKEAAKRARNN